MGSRTKDAPLVSVVIPTKDRADFVLEAIESVRAQTYPNKEIIVVDDGSSDGSLDTLGKLAEDDLIRLFQSPGAGASAARNEGVAQANGEFVAFLDSDDVYHIDKLARSVERLLAEPDAVFLHGSWIEQDLGRGTERTVNVEMEGDARHALLMFGRIATPTVVVRRAYLDETGGFDEGLELVEDYDLWCRLAAHGPLLRLEAPFTNVRLHGSNTTRNPARIEANQTRAICKYFDRYPTDDLQPVNAYLANSYYWASDAYLRAGHFNSAFAVLWRALRMDWGHSKRRALGMCKNIVLALIRRSYNWLLPKHRDD